MIRLHPGRIVRLHCVPIVETEMVVLRRSVPGSLGIYRRVQGSKPLDGISNFMEYALHTDPRVSGGAAVTPKPESGEIAFSFSRPHPSGVIYEIETSLNGDVWDSVARLRAGSSQWIDPRTGAAAAIVETGSGTSRDVVHLENPGAAPLKQIRLRVIQPN